MLTTLMTSAVVKAGMRKRRTSISGSARVSWRRTKRTPIPRPMARNRAARAEAVLRDRLQADDRREHRDQGHRRAEQVEPPGVGGAVLGEDTGAEDEQQRHHRH